MQNEDGAYRPATQGGIARHWLAGALLVVAYCAVRALCLPGSLWSDEIASYYFAQQPLSTLWSNWMFRETNPPLYYAILKVWMTTFGDTDLILRGPSLLCGLLTAVIAGFIAREKAGVGAGRFAAALVTLSSAQIYYSLDVRAYAQAELAALVALWGADQFVRSDLDNKSWRGLALYVVGTSAALYSHTMLAVFWIVVNGWMAAWLLMHRPSWRRLVLPWIGANLVVAILWAWWVKITIWQIGHTTNLVWIARPTPWIALREMVEIYGPGPRYGASPLIYLAWGGFGTVALVLLFQACKRLKAEFGLVYPIAAAFAPVLLYAISFKTPVLIPRAFLWAAAPLQISLAIGLASLPKALLRRLCGAVLLTSYALGMLCLANHPTEEPYRQIAEEIRHLDPRATVLTNQGIAALALAHYCPHPQCDLRVYVIRRPESLPVEPDAVALDGKDAPRLAQNHAGLFTLTRLAPFDPTANLSRTSVATPLVGNIANGDTLALARWQTRK